MNFKLLFALGALCLFLPTVGWAQKPPKYSNEFLNIGVGARAAAMGNTQIAITNDVQAGYWNPAGLMRNPRRHELALMHSEYFGGIAKYDYAAVATTIDDNHRLGVSFIRLGVDDIPNTLNFKDGNSFNYAKITTFSVADMAFLLSYAGKIKWVEGLNYGANLKVVHRGVGPFATAWGFGLDLGLQYRVKGVQLGLTLTDISSTFNAWTFNTEAFEEGFRQAGQEIPQNGVEITLPAARFGAGYEFFADRKINLTVAMDLNMHFDGPRSVLFNAGPISFEPNVGLEGTYKKIVFLRAGVMNMQRTPNANGDKTFAAMPTVGVGVQWKIQGFHFNVDYALSSSVGVDASLFSHLVALRVGFDSFQFRQK